MRAEGDDRGQPAAVRMVITQAKRASRRATFTLRSAISPVCSANLSSAKRSRANALTTRIEEIVSCVREVKSPLAAARAAPRP